MIKNRKVRNIEDGIKQINKIYLQRGFKITPIHSYRTFETLCAEVAYLVISLDLLSKKEHVPKIERFNKIIKACVL